MLTLHVRHSATRAPSTAPRATAQLSFAQTQSRAVVDAAIHLLTSYPMLSEADIARGYPLVIHINPRRAMH